MKGAASGVNRRQKCSQTTQHEIVQENEESGRLKKKKKKRNYSKASIQRSRL